MPWRGIPTARACSRLQGAAPCSCGTRTGSRKDLIYPRGRNAMIITKQAFSMRVKSSSGPRNHQTAQAKAVNASDVLAIRTNDREKGTRAPTLRLFPHTFVKRMGGWVCRRDQGPNGQPQILCDNDRSGSVMEEGGICAAHTVRGDFPIIDVWECPAFRPLKTQY